MAGHRAMVQSQPLPNLLTIHPLFAQKLHDCELAVVPNGSEHGANHPVADLAAICRIVQFHNDADIRHNLPRRPPVFHQKHPVTGRPPKSYRDFLRVQMGLSLAGSDTGQQLLQGSALHTGPPVLVDRLQKGLHLFQFLLQLVHNRLKERQQLFQILLISAEGRHDLPLELRCTVQPIDLLMEGPGLSLRAPAVGQAAV